MPKQKLVAVLAHTGKTFGGGLPALRELLAKNGHPDPIWYEVEKSSKATKLARRAVKKGAERVLVWGGDGMVQHSVEGLAGSGVPMAIVPAGTANLLATHLNIPKDIEQAVAIALHGKRKRMDVGVMNEERFIVMAGAGFDATLMDTVDSDAKQRWGELAYVTASMKAMQLKRAQVTVTLDGERFFKGKAGCILLGNIGTINAGAEVFPDASPSDGHLEVGIVTAKNAWQWLRVFSRVAIGDIDASPFIERARAKHVVVELSEKRVYQLDGGARDKTKRLEAHIEPGAMTCMVAS